MDGPVVKGANQENVITVPDVLKRLGVKDPITIAESEYDNLFIVTRPATGEEGSGPLQVTSHQLGDD